MARIIYSGLVQSINGSIAGTTFQRNAYGFTIKAKPNIVNPNRQRQAPARQHMQLLAMTWRNMTFLQRDSWNTYATAFPTASRKNPNSYLNGQALFFRINFIRLTVGSAINLNQQQVGLTTLFLGVREIRRVGGTLVYFDSSTDSQNAMLVNCYISAPIPPSRNYDRSETRYMGFHSLPGADQVDITAAYIDQFGVLPPVGASVFLRSVYWVGGGAQVVDFAPDRFVVI